MRDLIPYLESVSPSEGMRPTAIPFMRVNRRSRPGASQAHVLEPCVGIFVAGHKRAQAFDRRIDLREGDVWIVPHTTSVITRVVRAPYLCVMLAVDADVIASLVASPRAASSDISDPFARLVRLLEAPSDIPVLAPLIQRELFYRLLAGPSGDALRELARPRDPAVSSAISWLDAHFAEPFHADLLAARAHLSVSALYARFKARMGLTPLQYQKRRRLDAARRLLVAGDVDVKTVAHRVGYASAPQFSRDYRRAFGTTPRTDADTLRASGMRAREYGS